MKTDKEMSIVVNIVKFIPLLLSFGFFLSKFLLKMSIRQEFIKNGYVVIENFFTSEEVIEMKHAGREFSYEAAKNTNKAVFNSTSSPQSSDRYFLDSADKISYFYETDAVSEDGTLQCEPEISLNKVGHALHLLHPVFRKSSFHDKVKNICRELGLQQPVIVQSMYIYKNPKLGAEVNIHQDATYIYTEPIKLYGFWFALDDATEENGCLQIIPGSHNDEVTYRFIKNPDENSTNLCIHVGTNKKYENHLFEMVPVKTGSCVLIHGQVVHRSAPNFSDKSRHAYTFHVVDMHECIYSSENWLQAEFHSVYED